MTRQSLRAVLCRSGTSKGLFLRRSDLPLDVDDWTPIILSAVGSPDPYHRQLNGVGGGSSTTSKVIVVGPCEDPDIADVDYTFIQVPLNAPFLDFSGNCGNMSAGVAPFAIDEQLIQVDPLYEGDITIRMRNTNTNKILLSTLSISSGLAIEDGPFTLPGVSGSGAPIRLDFLSPSGSMTGHLLPTASPSDILTIPLPTLDAHPGAVMNGVGPCLKIRCSMVDAANPFVFVAASSLGLRGDESVAELAAITPLVQLIRAHASVAMGIKPTLEEAFLQMGCPKIAILSPPTSFTSTAGLSYAEEEVDITTRAYSMGLPHPTLQMTGAVCLAAAVAIPGTIPFEILTASRRSRRTVLTSKLNIAHLGGILVADSDVRPDREKEGGVEVISGSVYRTARRLMEGVVYYQSAGKGVVEAPDTPPSSVHGDGV